MIKPLKVLFLSLASGFTSFIIACAYGSGMAYNPDSGYKRFYAKNESDQPIPGLHMEVNRINSLNETNQVSVDISDTNGMGLFYSSDWSIGSYFVEIDDIDGTTNGSYFDTNLDIVHNRYDTDEDIIMRENP